MGQWENRTSARAVGKASPGEDGTLYQFPAVYYPSSVCQDLGM